MISLLLVTCAERKKKVPNIASDLFLWGLIISAEKADNE